MPRKLPKLDLTHERALHYKNLGIWLRANPQIQHRRLKVGFEINVCTVPEHLIDEFIAVSTFVK